LPPHRIQEGAIVLFLYAALYTTETFGLWFRKPWGEWLTIIATTSFIPFEVYEVAHKMTIVRVSVLVLNIAIVIFLLYRRRTLKSRKLMRRIVLLVLFLSACATSGPPTRPNDREWNLLMADYQWIQTLRAAQHAPPANATRKQEIELILENHRKIEPTYVAFMDKLREYHHRTGDPRAATVLANEKIIIGDEYMNVLSRYDKAIESYRDAIQIEPTNQDAVQRIEQAEQRRFMSMNAFAAVKTGMNEQQVRKLVGLPREDWIKQVVQNGRVYSVWIYPKADGGASAVYFDNGVVYHTNWNAAAPPQAQK
jgi:tetratricopeptide (TPR) repeat protein